MLNLEPGKLFAGRFEILRSIGAGGMGAVYLACDHKHRDFLVALKVLYPGVIKTREAKERFRNEIIASYRLNHKNIVRAYEYFDGDDVQAFAMEYVDGGDLASIMQRGPSSSKVVREALLQLATGLGVIHSNGIVHRDLKPENILVSNSGVYKISDFGVARLRGSDTLTQVGALVGTPKYVAPEYIELGECDHRGDIYALGVIAFELATGRSPFSAQGKTDMMLERFNLRGAQIVQYMPNCPKALIRVIDKMLSVSVTARYQNAAEIVVDLENADLIDEVQREVSVSHVEENTPSPTVMHGNSGQSAVVKSLALRARRRTKRRMVLALAAFAIMALIFVAGMLFRSYLHSGPRSVFTKLSAGVYTGEITRMWSTDRSLAFTLVKSKRGIFILLGIEGCGVQPVSPEGKFSCGELQFEIAENSKGSTGGSGVVRELGWQLEGTWSITAVGGEP